MTIENQTTTSPYLIDENTKLYKIGQASKLSGVPIETIRIWERRYDAVVPVRTKGGHRKYTEQDVDYLTALKAIVTTGTRIGQLVRLPRQEVLDAALALPVKSESSESTDTYQSASELSRATPVRDESHSIELSPANHAFN